MQEKLINIGKVISPHGIRGEIKVYPYTDYPERHSWLEWVRVKSERGDWKLFRVEKSRLKASWWLLKLERIDTREDAENLRNQHLYILPEERVSLPEDTYYYDQIIGLEVYTVEGVLLGEIKEILPTGGQDTYVVQDKNSGRKYLIPAVKDFLPEINLDQGFLYLDPPEGLLEL